MPDRVGPSLKGPFHPGTIPVGRFLPPCIRRADYGELCEVMAGRPRVMVCLLRREKCSESLFASSLAGVAA